MKKGTKHTIETLRKISQSLKGKVPHNKGKKHSEETRRKMSLSSNHISNFKGKKHSEESRMKISISNSGVNNPNFGKKHTEESRRKMSIANKGKIISDENKLATSKRFKGIPKSPEHIQKMSDSRAGIMPKVLLQAGRSGTYGHLHRGWYDINCKKLFFRSKWEANYALYLDFLKKQNLIKEWEGEGEVFMFEQIKLGTRSYRPDFKITNNDDTIEYHEVKGWMDSQSKTKLNRMRIYYPKIKMVLIDSRSYTDIENKVGRMLGFF